MSTFKVGDRVKAVGYGLGTVVEVESYPSQWVLVQYDSGKTGFTDSRGWFTHRNRLELIITEDEVNKAFDFAREDYLSERDDEVYFDRWTDWHFDYCDIDKPVVSGVSTETLNKVNEDWQETACQNITAVQQAYQAGLEHSGLEGLAAQCLNTATELHFADELHDNYDIVEFAAKMYKDFLKELNK